MSKQTTPRTGECVGFAVIWVRSPGDWTAAAADGVFTRRDARRLAKRLAADNPRQFYRIARVVLDK